MLGRSWLCSRCDAASSMHTSWPVQKMRLTTMCFERHLIHPTTALPCALSFLDLQVSEKQLYEVDKKLKMFEAMIAAMDEEERTQPDILAKDLVRQRRVAAASGFLPTQVHGAEC